MRGLKQGDSIATHDSILHLDANLPEEQAGLAMWLLMVSEEVRECARQKDEAEE